jgi:hypothetical protein
LDGGRLIGPAADVESLRAQNANALENVCEKREENVKMRNYGRMIQTHRKPSDISAMTSRKIFLDSRFF